MQNKYPVYVISKGRWERTLTCRALSRVGVDYRVVVEPQEAQLYARAVEPTRILTLPFSNLGQGSIPARNWVWEHSIAEGHARHWIIDDNITHFYRANRNTIIQMHTPSGFAAMEAFVDRYQNVPMAGPHYEMFKPRRHKTPPFVLNHRVYSCILLSNEPQHHIKWRGRYNEDTDLSLRFLKSGLVTVLFFAFLARKITTMTMKGGNTEDLYKQDEEFDGRLAMAQSLQEQHPDCVTVKRKWNRWQHHVDYRPFAGNRLVRKKGVEIEQGVDDFGMDLRKTIPPRKANTNGKRQTAKADEVENTRRRAKQRSDK